MSSDFIAGLAPHYAAIVANISSAFILEFGTDVWRLQPLFEKDKKTGKTVLTLYLPQAPYNYPEYLRKAFKLEAGDVGQYEICHTYALAESERKDIPMLDAVAWSCIVRILNLGCAALSPYMSGYDSPTPRVILVMGNPDKVFTVMV